MQHVTRHTPEDLVLLDSKGRFYEVPEDLLAQFRLSQERLERIVEGLPRDAEGHLQVPSWLEAVVEGSDVEVEGQGRALDLLSVAVLAAAGCAGTSSGLSIPTEDTECVSVQVVGDEPGATMAQEVCGPDAELPVPPGGMNVTVTDTTGVRFDGRVYVPPAKVYPIPMPGNGDAQPGGDGAIHEVEFRCFPFENGAPTAATLGILQHGQQIHLGPCGAPVMLAPDTYLVTVYLDGAIDHARRTMQVVVGDDGPVFELEASFETSILEVRIDHDGTRAAGLVELFRDNQRVGTIGSYVPGRLQSGTYDIVAHYRTGEQRFEAIDLAPGQRRALEASF